MLPQYVRFVDLQERGIVGSRTQLRRLQDGENFPRGVLLAPNTRAWDEAEILAWLATRRDGERAGG